MNPAPPVTRTSREVACRWGGWQGNLEAAASLDIAYGDLAIVGLNDPADNRKPEARPTVVEGDRFPFGTLKNSLQPQPRPTIHA
jgi:hypothetical protein